MNNLGKLNFALLFQFKVFFYSNKNTIIAKAYKKPCRINLCLTCIKWYGQCDDYNYLEGLNTLSPY